MFIIFRDIKINITLRLVGKVLLDQRFDETDNFIHIVSRFRKMIDRIIRVITMDQTVYAEVEHDDTLTSEALMVVVIASACAASRNSMATMVSALGSGKARM